MLDNELPEIIRNELKYQQPQAVPDRLWYKIESTINEKKDKKRFFARVLTFGTVPALAMTALAVFVSVQIIDSRNIEKEVNTYLQSLYYLDSSMTDNINYF